MKKYYLKKGLCIERLAAFEIPEKTLLFDPRTLRFTKKAAEACVSMGKILSSMGISHRVDDGGDVFFIRVDAKENLFLCEEKNWVVVCKCTSTLEYRE